MFDDTIGYRNWCSGTKYNQNKFIDYNITSYPVLEKLLGFQYEMNNALAKEYDNKMNQIPLPKNKNIPDKLNTEIITFTLCGLNIKYLFQALRPLEHNEIHVCASIIRPVFESIPKMFYLLCHPEDIQYVLCKEHFTNWISTQKYFDKIENRSESTKKNYFKKFLEGEGNVYFPNIQVNIEDLYEKLDNRYSNAWYRKQIYTQESLKLQDQVYSTLSTSAHANIFRSVNTEYDAEMSKKFMKILVDLSYFNLFLYVNAGWTVLEDIDELQDTRKFIDQIPSLLKTHYAMTYLRLGHNDLQNKIKTIL